MGENYDALSNALNNLDNTVMNIHEEVLVQNALIDNTADDVEQSKNVMDALTKKAQEYLGTSDNCQTCSATVLCIACMIMLVVVMSLYG